MNNKQGEAWKVWEQPESETRSLVAFKGAEAARRQGDEAFERFHMALLEARHERKAELNRETVLQVASDAGLDTDRFSRDLDSVDITGSLARDYGEAVGRGVFGTPTLFFGQDEGAYLRMMPASRGDEAVRAFDTLRQVIALDLNVKEIKRPQR